MLRFQSGTKQADRTEAAIATAGTGAASLLATHRGRKAGGLARLAECL